MLENETRGRTGGGGGFLLREKTNVEITDMVKQTMREATHRTPDEVLCVRRAF